LGAIGNKAVQVGQLLTFTVTATDPDVGQTLVFSSTALPTGATFDTATGAFSWTPTAGQAGDTPLTLTVTDNGTPPLNDNEAITITVSSTPVVNQPPVVNDQPFSVAENSANGTVVGTIAATDPDAGQTLSFLVTGGTGQAAFAVSSTGQITVADSTLLNFETTPSFTLNVTATANGTPALTDTAVITITLTDVNEAPVLGAIGNKAVQVGQLLTFTVTETDPDVGQTLVFSSTALPTGATFDTASGAFSWTPTAGQVGDTPLTFTVTDNGTPPLNDSESITITVSSTPVVNQPPVVNDQPFSVAENSANGTVVGTIVATDPDAGQTLSFLGTGGKGQAAFAVSSTGQITVADSTLLNFETTPSVTLNVTATDNGTPT